MAHDDVPDLSRKPGDAGIDLVLEVLQARRGGSLPRVGLREDPLARAAPRARAKKVDGAPRRHGVEPPEDRCPRRRRSAGELEEALLGDVLRIGIASDDALRRAMNEVGAARDQLAERSGVLHLDPSIEKLPVQNHHEGDRVSEEPGFT